MATTRVSYSKSFRAAAISWYQHDSNIGNPSPAHALSSFYHWKSNLTSRQPSFETCTFFFTMLYWESSCPEFKYELKHRSAVAMDQKWSKPVVSYLDYFGLIGRIWEDEHPFASDFEVHQGSLLAHVASHSPTSGATPKFCATGRKRLMRLRSWSSMAMAKSNLSRGIQWLGAVATWRGKWGIALGAATCETTSRQGREIAIEGCRTLWYRWSWGCRWWWWTAHLEEVEEGGRCKLSWRWQRRHKANHIFAIDDDFWGSEEDNNNWFIMMVLFSSFWGFQPHIDSHNHCKYEWQICWNVHQTPPWINASWLPPALKKRECAAWLSLDDLIRILGGKVKN